METLFDFAVSGMKAQAAVNNIIAEFNSGTETERLLRWFNAGNTITSFEAYSKFGITQLGRCIDDLQKKGHSFEKPREKTENGKIVVRYKLIKES